MDPVFLEITPYRTGELATEMLLKKKSTQNREPAV